MKETFHVKELKKKKNFNYCPFKCFAVFLRVLKMYNLKSDILYLCVFMYAVPIIRVKRRPYETCLGNDFFPVREVSVPV